MSQESKVLALKYRPSSFGDLIGQDIISEQEWNADMLDPYILKDYLTDLGYSTPPELQKEVDEFESEKEEEKKNMDNVIPFPNKKLDS